MDEVEVRAAGAGEREQAVGLLRACGLVWEDVTEDRPLLWVAAAEGRVVGCVGLELHPPAALLRSLAVAPEWRGRRVGSRLLARALQEARRRGAREAYLLTTGAAGYFARHGFRPVPRSRAPAGIRQTAEFRDLCPASAVLMRLDLEMPPAHPACL